MNKGREIIVLVGDEEVMLRKEVFERITHMAVVDGVIASCEIEGEVISEEEKEILRRYHPAHDVVIGGQLLEAK